MIEADDEYSDDLREASATSSPDRTTPVSSPVSRGSTLDSFTRGDGLRPAEEKLREAVMRGETCTIGDGTRPEFPTKQNTIRASFLRYLILGGCEQTPIHQRGVRLVGAFIVCRKTEEFGKCLDLQAADIKEEMYLKNCEIDGTLILMSANTKSVILQGLQLNGIRADRLICNGSFHFNADSIVRSQVRLIGAKVTGSVSFSMAKFLGREVCLHMDRIEVLGSIFFRDQFRATSNVRLRSSNIFGSLNCSNGIFDADLEAQNATIGGNVLLDQNLQTHGTVNLSNATISGNVYCDGGTFHNKDQVIQANKAVIDGNVILGAINSAGKIAFQSAHIKGDFSANGATLSGKPCLELRNAKIDGTFHWRDIAHALGRLDLGGASAKTINMDAVSWQKPETIKLNNFSYLGFENLEPGANSNYWKAYLLKQPEKDLTEKFRPKPWEHLAGVLDTMGYEEEARSIRIERQNLRTEFMAHYDPDRFEAGLNGTANRRVFHALNVFWRKVFAGPLVDYGYRPGKAVIFLLLLIGIGTGVYWKAAFNGIMTPTHPLIFKEAAGGFIPAKCAENWVFFPREIKRECADAMPSEYSEFQSFIYAADIALPIVDLRMENDWAPRVVNTDGTRNWWGYGVRAFEWFLIIAGWVLSLLFASAVGGIIRR